VAAPPPPQARIASDMITNTDKIAKKRLDSIENSLSSWDLPADF
jgi:hypothetical protein